MTWHLLVVDDEPLNLDVIGGYLEGHGYALQFASDGEAAWEALVAAAEPFDLLLLDRMMPRLSGMGLLARMKADARFCHVPVIMQTAASSPEQVREGIAAGAYYYLTKPYQQEALLGVVRAALDDVVNLHLETGRGDRPPPRALTAGEQRYFDFHTLEEAHDLAAELAMFCADPPVAAMGLAELMVNAVEHGNLGISYEEKKRLRQSDTWEAEVARRLADPRLAARRARVCAERCGDDMLFTISDAGEGFDWARFLDFDPARAFDPNGRGIAMARKVAFSSVLYRERGTVVLARLPSRLAAPGDEA